VVPGYNPNSQSWARTGRSGERVESGRNEFRSCQCTKKKIPDWTGNGVYIKPMMGRKNTKKHAYLELEVPKKILLS